jgi:hypothetical protein
LKCRGKSWEERIIYTLYFLMTSQSSIWDIIFDWYFFGFKDGNVRVFFLGIATCEWYINLKRMYTLSDNVVLACICTINIPVSSQDFPRQLPSLKPKKYQSKIISQILDCDVIKKYKVYIILISNVRNIKHNSNMTSFKRFESKPVVKIIFIYDRLCHR